MTKKPVELTNEQYRLGYHLSAPAGWINDPNGFCYYKGYYHIFYQHHPYSAEWGPMHWGHARSKDLIHWETLPIALAPDTPADEDGCFSGSAIVKDDVLYLFYTGHHYYGDNDPDHFWQNQNMAYSTDGVTFSKYEYNPIIAAPPVDNTHHFRDPKVWKHDENYYMILGSQSNDGLGRVITYRSENLTDWEYLGEISKSRELSSEGFMWECPDFFSLNNQHVLLLSPQGIEAQKEKYLNLFQTGYFIGDYDREKNTFIHGDFCELDSGHDFYAAQTTLSPDGRRLIFGWMNMWESEMPEQSDGWAGALTLPRVLALKNNRLIMQPVEEMKQLRLDRLAETTQKIEKPILLVSDEKQFEMNLNIKQFDDFKLIFKTEEHVDFITLAYNQDEHKFTLCRSDRPDNRYSTVNLSDVLDLQLYIDTSSVEIFINQGEAVFTERFYIHGSPEIWLQAEKALICQSVVYRLEKQTISF